MQPELGAKLELKLLGPMVARRGDETVSLPRSRKARALLAYLALARNGVSKEEACHLLFASASDPRGSLRWCLSRLRAALGGPRDSYIVTGKKIYLTDRVQTDVARLVNAGRSPVSQDSLVTLESGIDGVFLEDLEMAECPEFTAWLFATRSRFISDHAALLSRIIEVLPDGPAAIEYARRLVGVDGDSEEAWATLINRLRRSGNMREARAVYETAHRELRRENVLLTGRLRNAMDAYNPVVVPDLPDGSSEVPSISRRGAWRRPLLRIDRCAVAQGLPEALGWEVGAALYSAAARFKGCSSIAGDHVESDLSAGIAPAPADMYLKSRVRRTQEGLLLEVNLLGSDTHASLFGWQLILESADEARAARQVAAHFCNHFEVDLTLSMIGHALSKPEARRTVQDRFLLTLPQIYSAEGYDPPKVLLSLEEVLHIDPGYGPALCAMAWVRTTLSTYNSNPGEVSTTSSLARRAVQYSQDDPFVLGWAAVVIAHADRDILFGQDLVQRALSFNPYSPMALLAAGFIAHYAGNNDQAEKMIDRIEAHGSAGPMTFLCLTCRAMVRFQRGHYAAAEEMARRALSHNPTFILPMRVQAASLAKLGRVQEARRLTRRMVEIDPSEHLQFFRERSPYQSRGAMAALCDGLRLAGLPE